MTQERNRVVQHSILVAAIDAFAFARRTCEMGELLPSHAISLLGAMAAVQQMAVDVLTGRDEEWQET